MTPTELRSAYDQLCAAISAGNDHLSAVTVAQTAITLASHSRLRNLDLSQSRTAEALEGLVRRIAALIQAGEISLFDGIYQWQGTTVGSYDEFFIRVAERFALWSLGSTEGASLDWLITQLAEPEPIPTTGNVDDDFPLEDWRQEVANGDTRLGFTEWQAHRLEAETAAARPKPETPSPSPEANPRFVWIIGAIHERFRDIPEFATNDTVLYDRQERKVVLTLAHAYANLWCLEHLRWVRYGTPFTSLAGWLNTMAPGDLASEDIPDTRPEYHGE